MTTNQESLQGKGDVPGDQLRQAVILANVDDYRDSGGHVAWLLDEAAQGIKAGDKVLVKPNLLRADTLTCANAAIAAAVCSWLVGRGCAVMVGDSPGFGSATTIAKYIGLQAALDEAGCGRLPVVNLGAPVKRPLTHGGAVGIARLALEADHIVNVPKLKAHSQMRVTAAVKNLFGCVSGLSKAWLHYRHGDTQYGEASGFASLIADIRGHLPPVVSVVDAVRCMHVTGPSGGQPFAGRLLAASASPVAVDTVLYGLLGLHPGAVPLWQELRRRNDPGAFPEYICLEGTLPTDFDFSGFQVPRTLSSERFTPGRLVRSVGRRVAARFRPGPK